MKILFLTTQLPYPPISGGVIKSWKLVEHWGSTDEHELRIVCPLKNDDPENLKEFKSKLPKVSVLGIELNKKRNPVNLILSYLFSDTLNVYRNRDNQIQKAVEQWIDDSDVVVIDHYEMGQYVSKEHKDKVILHQHNAEYVMWERLAAFEKKSRQETFDRHGSEKNSFY